MRKRFSAFLIILLTTIVIIGGCVGNYGPLTKTKEGQEKTVPKTSEVEENNTPSSTKPEEISVRKKGVIRTNIMNTTIAVNASLLPQATFECLDRAPDVVLSYYQRVEEEGDVREFFDLDVVDELSLVELHNALYRAIDFKQLNVRNVTCAIVSINMVACEYEYSASIVRNGEEKLIQRKYVTFLNTDSCKIVWTEEEG
ncbi:hypothetical protein [Pyrococcus sp. ST04]|uniref:hypothetical protein n=1 Tax=Pyrococcus sp. ST04 TaxID=1183377 RepID=UPI0002605A6B|nr:hypothetical protein [Pyrococcus sp. ST04]AFK22044.1 hypothetical protein Py04_0442 [Pyrococcus sp. ST04]